MPDGGSTSAYFSFITMPVRADAFGERLVGIALGLERKLLEHHRQQHVVRFLETLGEALVRIERARGLGQQRLEFFRIRIVRAF